MMISDSLKCSLNIAQVKPLFQHQNLLHNVLMAIIGTKCFLRPDPRQCFHKCWLRGGGARPQPCAGLLGGVFTMDDGGGGDVMSHHHHHMTPTPSSWTMWSASATPPTHFCPTTRLWRWTTIDASASSANFCPKTVNQHNHENVCKHHHHQSASPSLSSKSFSKGFLQPRPSRHLGCVGHYHHHHHHHHHHNHCYHYHHPPFHNFSTFFEIFLIKSIIMKWSSPMIRCVGPHLQQNPTQTQSQRSCLGQNNHLQMHKFKEAVVT